MANLYVKSFDTGEVVKIIPLKSTGERHVERVMLGLLRNMNTDDYYIDDSEVE
jgi:hypothetical protein